MSEDSKKVDVVKGDMTVKSAKDDTVVINLNREDALDLWQSLVRANSNYADQTFAHQELSRLLRRFFTENKDVDTLEESNRLFKNHWKDI